MVLGEEKGEEGGAGAVCARSVATAQKAVALRGGCDGPGSPSTDGLGVCAGVAEGSAGGSERCRVVTPSLPLCADLLLLSHPMRATPRQHAQPAPNGPGARGDSSERGSGLGNEALGAGVAALRRVGRAGRRETSQVACAKAEEETSPNTPGPEARCRIGLAVRRALRQGYLRVCYRYLAAWREGNASRRRTGPRERGRLGSEGPCCDPGVEGRSRARWEGERMGPEGQGALWRRRVV